MNILLTKVLSRSVTDLITSWGWTYETIEALSVTVLDPISVPEKSDVWVASSRNSLRAMRKFKAKAPASIFVVGSWLESRLADLFQSQQIQSFANMKALAAAVDKKGFKEITYFCGDVHRDDLEKGVKNAIIHQVITHESKPLYPVIQKQYDGITVFSPRSGESLLRNNHFDPATVFICIGETTERWLHAHGITKTFCVSYPESKLMMQEFYNSTIS